MTLTGIWNKDWLAPQNSIRRLQENVCNDGGFVHRLVNMLKVSCHGGVFEVGFVLGRENKGLAVDELVPRLVEDVFGRSHALILAQPRVQSRRIS